jgi:hypothetical protein
VITSQIYGSKRRDYLLFKMHPWQSQYQEVLSSFLMVFTNDPPCYVSLNKSVKTDDPNGMFFQVLGLSNNGSIALCKAVGLVSIQILKGNLVMRIEHEQWRNLIPYSDLCESTDYNPTQLNNKNLDFINLGNNNIAARGLYYTPQQQYYKKSPPMPHYRLHMQHRQLRLAVESLDRHYNTPDVLPQHRELVYTVQSRNLPSAFKNYLMIIVTLTMIRRTNAMTMMKKSPAPTKTGKSVRHERKRSILTLALQTHTSIKASILSHPRFLEKRMNLQVAW